MGYNGHVIEKVYKIPFTDQWEDKGSQQHYGSYVERL